MGLPGRPFGQCAGLLLGLVVLSAAISGVGVTTDGPDPIRPIAPDGAGSTASSANQTSVTVTGVVSGIGLAGENLRAFTARLLNRNVSTLPRYGFGLVVDGKQLVVLADSPAHPGVATATGEGYYVEVGGNATVINGSWNETTDPAPDIIIAESVTVRTEGEQVLLSELSDNLSAEQGRLVELRSSFRHLSVIHYTAVGPTYQLGFGRVGSDQLESELLRHPGLAAQTVVIGGPYEVALNQVGTQLDGGLRTRTQQPSFWVDGSVTIDGVVYARDFPHFGPQLPGDTAESGLYVTNLSVHGERVEDFTTLNDNTGRYVGQVVTLTTNLTGVRISAARTVGDQKHCDQPAQYVNTTQTCIPLPADVTVHAGVLHAGSVNDRPSVLPYTGISNHLTLNRTRPQNGTYRMTGRIVPIADIDPRLGGGYGMLVYAMHRVNATHAQSGPRPQARAWATAVAQAISWQLNATVQQRSAFLEYANAQSPPASQATLSLVQTEFTRTSVSPGTPITLRATIHNNGTTPEEVTLRVRTDDRVFDTATLTVPPDGNVTADFQFAIFESGVHPISINNWSAGNVTVRSGAEQTRSPGAEDEGFVGPIRDTTLGIAALAVAIGATVAVIYFRRI